MLTSCMSANAFFRSVYIESWCRIIHLLRGECRRHGSTRPPLWWDKGPRVQFPFARVEGTGTDGKTRENILGLIAAGPKISTEELTFDLGMNNGVEWHLRRLNDAGNVQRIGADRGGHWECGNGLYRLNEHVANI
jgi:hypothetical protein